MAAEDAVIITGRVSDQVVEQCLALGVNHLLEKPVRPYALCPTTGYMLHRNKYLRFAPRLRQGQVFALQAGLLGTVSYQ